MTKRQKSSLTASCKRALATALGAFSNCSPEKLFPIAELSAPTDVMKQAALQCHIDLTDAPLWRVIQAESPGQRLATKPLLTTFAENVLAEAIKKGHDINHRNKLPRPPVE